MKQLQLIFLLLIFSFNSFSQQKIYLNDKLEKTTKRLATLYAICSDSSDGSVNFKANRRPNDLPFVDGRFKDKTFTVLEGQFAYYNYEGGVNLKGLYQNNLRVGIWKTYNIYGNLMMEQFYVNGTKSDSLVEYNCRFGERVFAGKTTKDGEQYGFCKTYFHSKITTEGEFYFGHRIRVWKSYDSTGVVKCEVDFGSDTSKMINDTCFNPNHFITEEMPQYIGGENALLNFIGHNIKYPEVDRLNYVVGKVYIQFVVNEIGDVEDVEICDAPTWTLGNAALRVVKKLAKWTPGKQNGKPVKVYYTLPIDFNLN
ncbi:MAG: hypothetical protein RIQ33_2454 [Bacteroidota bacterium]|jgi:TonB family protein